MVDRQSMMTIRQSKDDRLIIVGDTYQTKEMDSHSVVSLSSLSQISKSKHNRNNVNQQQYNSHTVMGQKELGLKTKKKSNLNLANLRVLETRPQSFKILINEDFNQKPSIIKK